jgi:prepilin-type N-terminal cleavage/methylation domain-containing protein
MNNQTKDGPPVQSFLSPLRSRRGFSILELLVVVSIIMVVSAIAFPTVTRTIRVYRLNGMAANVSSMLQLARFEAVRLNRTNPPLSMRSLVVGNQTVLWVDRNGNGAIDATEPQTSFPREIQFLPAGTGLSVASMGYANTSISPAAVAFDGHGTVNFGVAAPVVYVFVFGYPNQPNEGYTAVSLLPSGKTQQWRASAIGPWQRR